MRIQLITRKNAWCLTLQGWALILGVTLLGMLGLMWGSPSFLSPTLRVNGADVLVVEGWLPDYALKGAAEEFQRGNYRYVITAGSPLLSGYYLSDRKTSADLAADTLIALGLESNKVVRAPGPMVLRGRSLAHAKAVHEWVKEHDPALKGVNVYTISVHARRTWKIFEGVVDGRYGVGIIAHPDEAYDLKRWWMSSEGLKSVLGEWVGWLWMTLRGVD